MKLEEVAVPDLHPQLRDHMEQVQDILNNGKYQQNVLSTIPSHSTEEGCTALYASGSVRRMYAYMNSQWCYFGFTDVDGKIIVDGELYIGSYLKANGTNGLWLGHAEWANAAFRVNLAGGLWATSATIAGAITATSGSIGGFTIGDGKLTAGSGSTAVGMAPGTYPFYAGGSTAASAPFRVLNTGLVELGDPTGAHLHLDGPNVKIESSNYVSGAAGAGFTLQPDLLEVGNIACRGIFRMAVFETDTYAAIGGSLLVTKGSDVLDADMTALDASTLTIEGNETFEVNDVLVIKDGVEEEWFLVTNIASAPTYTVTRDRDSQYGADSNPAWTKGASVVNFGPSGAGGIKITASETNAPHMDVFTHAGAPYTTLTTRVRIGNLNGVLGESSDVYGIAIGEENKHLKYDPTNGLRITGGDGTAQVLLFPDADTGIKVTDDAGATVFETLIAGTDIGDVIIGDFANDKGCKWDKSAATFSVRGTLNATDMVAGTLAVTQGGTGLGTKIITVTQYTGNGADNRDIAHGLGGTPGLVLISRSDTTIQGPYLWLTGFAATYAKDIAAGQMEADRVLSVDGTNVEISDYSQINGNTVTFTMYCILTQ